MLLVQLVYASRAADDMTKVDLGEILDKSRSNNAGNDITGSLLYNSQFFLQCLEGSRVEVNKAYMRILQDTRHSEPALLFYQEVAQRDFPGWAMGYVGEGVLHRETFLRFSANSAFNPFNLTGDSARGLLLELARQKGLKP